MPTKILQILAFLLAASSIRAWAQAPKDGVYISDADVKAVLKRAIETKRVNPDNAIRVIDMGKYQLSVSVIHRGATVGLPATAANTNGGENAAGAAAANSSPACGEQRDGASGPGGILHDDTAETYIVTSGSATLITGGAIVNGKRAAHDDEITTILNGPSCRGIMVRYTTRQIQPGDIIVIPEGVPHGFSAIPDHVTYLSIRPDLKKVLQHGYVNPAIKNKN
jgi:mannose-6-phosphate isomerase-like protein (cupin superfamily)